MAIEESQPGQWLEALQSHEREIGRLRAEIATLERERQECGEAGAIPAIVRLQIEFASAQLTRHCIGAALMAARLRPPA